MSYYRSNHEVIKNLNGNMRTRAFTQSIQKYILDLLNGIRIENLENLKIEMDMDDI